MSGGDAVRIHARSPLAGGLETEARLSTRHPACKGGQPVVAFEDGGALTPEWWVVGDYEILEATDEEIEELRSAGFPV